MFPEGKIIWKITAKIVSGLNDLISSPMLCREMAFFSTQTHELQEKKNQKDIMLARHKNSSPGSQRF